MLNAITDSLSNLASSQDEEDGEDEDDDEEDTGLHKLSEDDEPCWVMGNISITVHHHTDNFQPKQMRLDKLMQSVSGDMADYFHEREMKYGMTELKVPAVGKPQTDTTTATPSQTTFGDLMQTPDLVLRQSQMPKVTSRQGTCQMRLGLEKLWADNHIVPPVPT
jgi:hypothetical protein